MNDIFFQYDIYNAYIADQGMSFFKDVYLWLQNYTNAYLSAFNYLCL